MTRPTCATFSTDHLLHNLSVIKAKAPRSRVMAMIKANAYGHGLIEVGKRLDGQIDALGVASIGEAMTLRRSGVAAPITLIEGVFEPDELSVAAEQNFHVVFHDDYQIDWLDRSALRRPITAWLKLYTGMGRLGFELDHAHLALERLKACPSVQQPVGLMSHFACADEPSHELNAAQISAFEDFAKGHNGPKSLCNSAGIFAFPKLHLDWVRPGLSLYGASPLDKVAAASLDLKPVMKFTTKIIGRRNMTAGSSVGYGARFTCSEDMPVGILAVGYGDGYPRSASNATTVLVQGTKCPVAGRVSMDMTAIDLRPSPNAKVGDDVTLWGNHHPVEDVAATVPHISYDLLTGLQGRVTSSWR